MQIYEPQCFRKSSRIFWKMSRRFSSKIPISRLLSSELVVKFSLHKNIFPSSRSMIFACKYGSVAKIQSSPDVSNTARFPSLSAVQTITFFPLLSSFWSKLIIFGSVTVCTYIKISSFVSLINFSIWWRELIGDITICGGISESWENHLCAKSTWKIFSKNFRVDSSEPR